MAQSRAACARRQAGDREFRAQWHAHKVRAGFELKYAAMPARRPRCTAAADHQRRDAGAENDRRQLSAKSRQASAARPASKPRD